MQYVKESVHQPGKGHVWKFPDIESTSCIFARGFQDLVEANSGAAVAQVDALSSKIEQRESVVSQFTSAYREIHTITHRGVSQMLPLPAESGGNVAI